jgi:tetratricopeptide (TPR) repeat protein
MSAQLKENSTIIQGIFAQARQQHEAGRLSEAECLYRQVVALAPDSAVAHVYLGVSLKALGRLNEAIDSYNRALELNPGYVGAYDCLGNALKGLGRLDEALAAYHRVVVLKPKYAEGHYNLGNVLLGLSRPEEAVAAFHAALALKPELVEAYNNLGAALAELGRIEEALIIYDKAASLQLPGFDNPLANKALLLMENGQANGALEIIEQALAINPNSANAWHLRSDLKRFVPNDPDIEAMEAMLAVADMRVLPLEDRVRLEFALGKAWMDAGDAERAFAHLGRGNRLKRSTFVYDSEETDRWIAEIVASFTPALMDKFSGAGYASEVPVFVVGMPRSGTTLVEQILASHPNIHGAGELTVLQDLVARGPARKSGAGPDYPKLLDELLPEDLFDLGREYEQRMRAVAQPGHRVVDKNPTNFLYAGLIHLILPNARIIHCRRDPVDTCLSCYTKLFRDVRFARDLRELGSYYRCYEALMSHWRDVLPAGRFTEVHYEHVVDDLEGQARRLIEFCGQDWNAACLRFHETHRSVRTASVNQVRQPIYRSSVGRWRPYAPYLGPLLDALNLDISSVTHDSEH